MTCLPLSDEVWPEEIADLRESFAGRLNVYRVMAHHPSLLRAWAPLRQHVVLENALGMEFLEIVILRSAHCIGSDYEWQQHVSRARAVGMSDERIAAVREMPEGIDGLLVQAVDALFSARSLPGPLREDLTRILGKAAVIDLLATVGFYSVLGFLLKSYETPLDDDIAAELAQNPLGS